MYEKFAALLTEKKTTAYAVSKATGIRPSCFTDWKHGRCRPKADKLKKIADFFGVSIEELI